MSGKGLSPIDVCPIGPGAPQWSRLKGVVILIGSAVLIALCGDLIADNIQTFLRSSGISEVRHHYLPYAAL